MRKRIMGFDLARAYAIFGMYIVNFNIVFGNYQDQSLAGQILSLFSGNSSTLFVMLAGMGFSLMSNSTNVYSAKDKKRLITILNKRAWFLFFGGLLLYFWWPADILHFYGGYMHIAVFLLFINKKYYIYASIIVIIIFHFLLFIIPYETGWNFETLTYKDFWTVTGFLRNTLYNGWNSIFPWLAFFLVGMYLGRLNWTLPKTIKKTFFIGLTFYITIIVVQTIVNYFSVNEEIKFYMNADYLPPFLPFVISSIGFGMMLISIVIYLSKFVVNNKFANDLAKTGQMTLTHYISHLTIGMFLLALFTDNTYSAKLNTIKPLHPILIFCFALAYFILSFYFSKLWTKKFNYGPFETLMRKISG